MKYRERRQLHNETDTALSIPDHIVKGDKPREFEAERHRPGREPNLESDVFTPLFSTLIVWAFSFGLSLYFILRWEWPWHYTIPISMIVAGVYFILYSGLIQKTLWITERVFQLDLDRDGEIGEPVTELSAIIEQEDGYTRMVRDKLNIDPAIIDEWVKGIAVGKTLAVNVWAGQGGIFTRAEYDNLLATLSDMGLAENVSGKKWQLTHTGKRWVRGMAE